MRLQKTYFQRKKKHSRTVSDGWPPKSHLYSVLHLCYLQTMWPLTVERVANETLAHRDEARNADDGFLEHAMTHACKPSQQQIVERYFFLRELQPGMQARESAHPVFSDQEMEHFLSNRRQQIKTTIVPNWDEALLNRRQRHSISSAWAYHDGGRKDLRRNVAGNGSSRWHRKQTTEVSADWSICIARRHQYSGITQKQQNVKNKERKKSFEQRESRRFKADEQHKDRRSADGRVHVGLLCQQRVKADANMSATFWQERVANRLKRRRQ